MIKQIVEIVGKTNIKEHYSLKNCTSFGIGGEARVFVTPDNITAMFNLLKFVRQNRLRYKIVGNGTNLLFGDSMFDGVIISTKKLASVMLVSQDEILASSGTPLPKIIAIAKENNLSGLEFAVGIPGSVGGAIVMNAGAEGGDISSVLKSVTIIDRDEIKTVESSNLEFGYRSSWFLQHPQATILFAEFKLAQNSSSEKILERMENYQKRRFLTQPKERSAGCVFKKCGEFPAGWLIDKAGLKNLKIGDARVSGVHANFIVNDGNATSKDVKELIEKVRSSVWEKFQLKLELEVEIID